jgi:type II secretory pathway pseudopilin PulG
VRACDGAGDEGSTLIETIVALALVLTAMAAMGPFFVNSFLIVNQQRTTQTAAQLADSAINQLRALKGSSLVTGRGFAKTDQQWCSVPFPPAGGALSQIPTGAGQRAATCAANAATPYLATMQEVWDPLITGVSSTLGDDAAIPTATQTMTAGNASFARTIYVGACDIYVGGTGSCVNSTVVTPPADGTKDLQFFRAVVLVTWTARECPTGTCSYVTSTLLSRASEPVFDFHRPSPVITTTKATFYRNTSTTFQLVASGGQLPNVWTATPVPTGLTVTPAGVLSGTPITLGTTTSTVTATDTLGRADTDTVVLTVVAPPALTLPGTTVAHVGDPITQVAAGTGGVAPLTYTATGLPTGLSINSSTGAITGTITAALPSITTTVAVTVTDANTTFDNPAGVTGSYSFSEYPAVVLASIPDQTITLGSTVSVTASGSGGDGRYTYSATGLPLGVTINSSTGVLSGLPAVPGRYLPTVTATDGSGGSASQRFALLVNSSTALIFTSPAPSAPDQASTVGSTVSLALASNAGLLGLSPATTVTGLPPGLTLNPLTGTISGRPTTAGTYTVTAVVTNLLPPQTSVLTFLWKVS